MKNNHVAAKLSKSDQREPARLEESVPIMQDDRAQVRLRNKQPEEEHEQLLKPFTRFTIDWHTAFPTGES